MNTNEVILTGLVVTIVGGILVAVVLGFVGPFTRPWTRRIRSRVTSPLKATFAPEPIYTYEQGVFAAVPTTALSPMLSTVMIEEARTDPHAAYVCPTPFVLTLRNTASSTDPRDVYVREMYVDITQYWPPPQALQNMALVQATTVQAGGRMLEASFTVILNTTRPVSIPLIQSAATEQGAARRPLHIPTNANYQVGVSLLPVVAGRYSFDVSIETDEGGEIKRIPIAQRVALVECTDLRWARETIRTFNWRNPEQREHGVAPALQQRWAKYHQDMHHQRPPLSPGRRVKVEGYIHGP